MEIILEKINKAALNLLLPVSLQETYEAIVRESIKLMDGDNGMLFLEKNGFLEKVYASSKSAVEIKYRKNDYIYTSFIERKAFVIYSDQYNSDSELLKIGIKSSLFIPLSIKKKSIGVLCVHNFEEKKHSAKQLASLKLFGTTACLVLMKTQALNHAEKAIENRDLFISMAVHELRTPLTTINGYAQLLKTKFPKDSPYNKWAHEIVLESQRLSKLIEALLSFSI